MSSTSVRVTASCGHWVDVWVRWEGRIGAKQIREQENNVCAKCAKWFRLPG